MLEARRFAVKVYKGIEERTIGYIVEDKAITRRLARIGMVNIFLLIIACSWILIQPGREENFSMMS